MNKIVLIKVIKIPTRKKGTLRKTYKRKECATEGNMRKQR